jgi:hypothetical protein
MNELATRALQGEVLGPEATVRVIGRARTFRQEVTNVSLPAGLSISELLRIAIADKRSAFPMDYAVSIDGLPVPSDLFPRVRPKAGRTVTFEPRLGSGSTGRSILLIAAAIAAIVVAVAFPILVPTLLGSAALSTVVGGLLAGGIAVGAQMAANALFPIAAPAEAIVDAAAGAETVYSIQGAQNQADPYGPIPSILGRVRVFPRYAAQPFTSFSGEDQYLRMLFCLGYGPLDISDMKIGETDIADFEGISWETFEGYAADGDPTLYTKQAFEEALSVELTKAAGWQQRTTPADITAISVDISAPAGIYKIDKETGDIVDYRIRVRAEYSPTGAGTWSLIGEIDKTISRQEPKRWGLEIEVPSGQYDVRVSKQSGDNDNESLQVQEQLYWTTLRSFRADPTIAFTKQPLALVALKIKATGQLNSVIDSFNCVLHSRVNAYDGATWDGTDRDDWTESSNPADLFRHVLQGPAIYEAVPDTQIDEAALEAWWDYCDAEGWEYNREHNFRGSVFDQLQAICAAGRARLVRTDGKWGVIYDEADPPVAQHFTPRNSWGFEEHRVYVNPPHAFRVNFVNAAKGWVPDEVIVYDDGYTAGNATRFEAIEFPGVTDQDLNWRHARFQLAQLQLRPSTYTLTTNWQAVACTVGDRVYVAHDVTFWGLFQGRVKAFNSVGDILTLDQEVVFEAGKEYQVRIRLADGTSVLRSVVHPGTAGNRYTFALQAGTDPEVGDLVMFGEDDPGPAILLRVREIEWQPDLRARITLVDDAPEISDADTGEIPAYDSGVTTPASLFLRKPSNPQVTESLRSVEGITYTDVQFTWQQLESALVKGFEAQIKNDSAAVPEWERMALTAPTQTWAQSFAVTPATYSFRVRAQFINGAWSDWTTLNSVSIAGTFEPPGDVLNFRISVLNDTATLTWDRVSRDVAYYTVKHTPTTVGATWGAATVLRQQVSDTSVLVPALNGTYLIKAVRSSGVESASAAIIIATGANLISLNSVEVVSPDPTWAGEHYGTKVVADSLIIDFVPLDADTKTMLQFEGADGSTDIEDETGNHTWTARGTAEIDDEFVSRGAGALLCGSAGYVDTPDHADFSLGSAAFTIALRFYVAGGDGTLRYLAGQIDAAAAAATSAWALEITTGNKLKFSLSTGVGFTAITSTTSYLAADLEFHELVVIRTGNILRMFIDGVQEGGDVAFSSSVPNSSATLAVGRAGDLAGTPWNGSIDNFSLSTGIARWTAAYTIAPARAEYEDLLTDTQHAALVALGRYDFITGAGSPTEEIDLGEIFTSRVTATLLAFGSNVNNVMSSWLTLASLESLAGSDSEDWLIIMQERHTEDDPNGVLVSAGDGTAFGDLNGGGGLAGAFDSDVTEVLADCAINSGSSHRYIGKLFSEPRYIRRILIYGSSDQGFNQSTNAAMTFHVYAKNGGAPANDTDGTLIGTLNITDTADESAGRQIECDESEAWDRVWVRIQNDGGATFNIAVAELQFYESSVWTEWAQISISDITGRAFQFRIWLFTFNRAIVTTVEMADANVDMPDRTEPLGDLAVGTGGLVVTFDEPFRHLETVVITAIQSAVSGDHPVISARSETGFTVHVKDGSEANVARTVDAVAHGYGRVVA